MRKHNPAVKLHCPYCDGGGRVELELTFRPSKEVAKDETHGYSEQGEKPEFRYACPTSGCSWQEIWTSPPSYQT